MKIEKNSLSNITVPKLFYYIVKRFRWYRYMKFFKGYLEKKNWQSNTPADENGVSPWFTYPATKFLRSILEDNFRVFEYGSGSSTLFFSDYCRSVVTIEHDKKWHSRLKNKGENVTLVLSELDLGLHDNLNPLFMEYLATTYFSEEFPNTLEYATHGLVDRGFIQYALELLRFPKHFFDVIVIDGMARNFCGYLAASQISEKGILILDNSDRWQYNGLMEYLSANGFARIDFWGPGPINSYEWCTSIFSRKLDIFLKSKLREQGSGDLVNLSKAK